MEEKIKVQGKEVSKEEFIKLKEDMSNDPSKKLKKISETEYTILQKING